MSRPRRTSSVLESTPSFAAHVFRSKTFFDCLEDGETLEQFPEQFPTVTREGQRRLELSKESLLDSEAAA